MQVRHAVRRTALALSLSLLPSLLLAQTQTATKPFEPSVGQAGKDVVWVPTSLALVNKMLDMAKVTPQDFVMDLGSGDGRTVITAAKRGARAMGIEYNPDMVELSKQNAAKENISTEKATFVKADLFETDFSKASVITMFLLPDINLKLRPKILDLKPGTRVASNTFTMGEWEADETAQLTGEECQSWCTALLWIVPAKVEGTWKMPQGQLTLKQTFQKISGSISNGGAPAPITDARLRGDEISFTASGTKYTGKVSGNSIQGSAGTGKFTATRAQ
jgi:hypothetical protein